MFKQHTAIICLMLFPCTPLNAMFPDNADENFQEYLRTGESIDDNPMNMELITKGFDTLETTLPAAKLDKDISTPAYAAQLAQLPSSEITQRYKLYRTMHTTFLTTLFVQQAIAKRLSESTTPEESTKLESFSQPLEQRRIKTSAWLTAIRKSGEEHYVGVCHLDITGENGSRREFWESTLKPRVLTNLKRLYCEEIYLSPEYMTILRAQLDSDLDPS